MNWSEQTWKSITPIYEKIIAMPFITELISGKLPEEKFRFYMMQDSCYLDHFGRALAVAAAKANDIEDALALIRFAENAIIVENALHASYFQDFAVQDKGAMQPACHHYVHYLKSTVAFENIEVGLAALLPCFWIYKAVGDHIYKQPSVKNNPYQKWIDTYAGEEFAKSVQDAIRICDRLATQTTANNRTKMTEAFQIATQLEFDFWEAGYTMRKW